MRLHSSRLGLGLPAGLAAWPWGRPEPAEGNWLEAGEVSAPAVLSGFPGQQGAELLQAVGADGPGGLAQGCGLWLQGGEGSWGRGKRP